VLRNLFNDPVRVKRWLIIGLVFTTVLVVFLAFRQSTRGTLDLRVAPQDATIITSKGAHLKIGSNTLTKGSYTITISRPHFVSKTLNFTIQSGQTTKELYGLAVGDAIGLQYYTDHPDQKAIADGITGQQLDAIGAQVAQSQPLVTKLPIENLTWRLDAGQSKKYPNDPTKVAIYITIQDEAARQAALSWMTTNGYAPRDYEIIFQDVAAYSQQLNSSGTPSNTGSPATDTSGASNSSNIDYN
jgi:hypothetical protein